MAADHDLNPANGEPLLVEVRPIDAEETRRLRHSVLRPSQAFDATAYPGDDDAATRHFGAFQGGRLVGVASIYREDPSGDDHGGALPGDGWRLRGMATAPEARGLGAGRALLSACVDYVAANGGGLLWCNARTVAAGFYTAAGFAVVGEEFDIPGIGPHVVASVRVTPSSPS